MLATVLFAVGVAAMALEPAHIDPAPKPIKSKDCETICADYINDCGQMYGGCFENCPGEPWPTFDPPPCPSPTTTTPACNFICVDLINECGQWYGGCYDDCKPRPTYTPPPCSYSTIPPPASTSSAACTTVCADYVNECGIWYGGCYNPCEPKPAFTPPPCPSKKA
ncbi:unnamed protein product [Zymoseptoria tritici ST99CH_1A5]|uniref:Uncharacterized protein n=1 Tax=Zymoseptoria tritici ST99CH_1A5 TaxID=1276529 RepID=A0A1Y6LDJ0_ZYMTR|nr:unnamed protein product [Zymoseptoria tritici ST99CH_1A5]